MSFDLLVMEDVCADCVIRELEQSGDAANAEIAAALRKGRDDPRRNYERELHAVAAFWPQALRVAEHTCRRRFKRCSE